MLRPSLALAALCLAFQQHAGTDRTLEGEACLAPVETAASSAGTGQALRETVRELSFPGQDYQFFTRK